MKNKIILFLICVFSTFLVSSQSFTPQEEINPRIENPVGVNFNLFSPYIIGLSVDYFATPNFNISAGLGPFNLSAGVDYHFGGHIANKNWTPMIGLDILAIHGPFDFLLDLLGVDVPLIFYIPLGIHYQANGGFNFAADVGPLFTSGGGTVYVGLKLGYHF